jgi:hypothetical protein
VLGDLFGERGGIGAVVEPDLLLDGDTESIGEPDAHAPDCAAGGAQEPITVSWLVRSCS